MLRKTSHRFFLLFILGWMPDICLCEPGSIFEKELQPFFEKHCVSCHGPEKEKGDIRLDELPAVIDDEYSAELWQEVLDVLNAAEMPPEDEPQPSTDELASAIGEMTDSLFEARKRLVDSPSVTIRRLNKREYANTIRDLLGVSVDTASLPADGTLDGFDTVGDAHFMSVPQFQQYLALGREALNRALVSGPRPEQQVRRVEPEVGSNKKAGESVRNYTQIIEGAEEDLRKPGVSDEDRQVFEKSIASFTDKLQRAEGYLGQPAAESGFILDITQAPFGGQAHDKVYVSLPAPRGKSRESDAARLGDPIGRYVARFRAGLTTPPEQGQRLFVEMVRTDAFNAQVNHTDPLGAFEITRTMEDPHVFEVPFENFGELNDKVAVKVSKLNEAVDTGRRGNYRFPDSTKIPYVWVDWIEVEGPILDDWPPAAWQTTFFNGDTVDDAEESSYAREIIARFAKRAFRGREASPDFLARLHAIYQDYRESGFSFPEAIKEPLAVVLASPSFVYLVEQPSKTGEKQPLSSLELASRLSYFLWSHPPDAELRELAESGDLTRAEVMGAQVARMLDDPRATHFTEAFISQWLELEWLDMIVVNTGKFPDFSETVRRSMREEPIEMFRHLLRENGGIEHLIDSDFAMLDPVLSRFYDVDPKEEVDGFQKVSLPENSPRGGLLGMGAILTMTGTGERTSPVERGVFVYSHLLGRDVPPPPPNVPQLEITDDDLTVRETLQAHISQPQCASCHRRMDPLGFGLEHFDAIGLWRDEETQFVEREDGGRAKRVTLPIDASGAMPDRERAFDGHEELKEHLLEESDAMAEGFLKSLLTYALGRRVGFSDGTLVEEMQAEWKSEEYGMRSLIHAIVQSTEFQSK